MTPTSTGTRSLYLIAILCLVLGAACGKKGAPLPPLQRIPAPIADLSVTRVEGDVFARFTVPTRNVDGAGPGDVGRVELYAFTSERPHADLERLEFDDLRKAATRIAAEDVRRVLPPLPPPKEGAPPVPLPPPGPGVDQGSTVVVRETLTPALEALVKLPEPDRKPIVEEIEMPHVVIGPTEYTGPVRYYFAVAVSPRGRYGPRSGLVPAPFGPTSSAPSAPEITFDQTSTTIAWKPAPDARGALPATPEDWLPSRPVPPGPPPTTYDVYAAPSNATPAVPANETPDAPRTPANATPDVPTPLTPAPVGALQITQPQVTLGVERCFVVRPVDILSGVHVRGPASPVACSTFADTFPPSAPSSLAAVATSGQIRLIWEPSSSNDLAGYLVLRGTEADAPLTPVTKEPIAGTTYSDDAVKPGVRYIYAIVAVDKAGNRSEESNRFEETARQ